MSKLTIITDRALELAEHAGSSIRHAVPHAGEWVKARTTIGAARTGAHATGQFIKRNPVAIAVAAAVVGAGIAAYVIYHNKRKQEAERLTLQGRAKQIGSRLAIARRQAKKERAISRH
ncbi:MAG: hypothetical protein LBL59_08030 [Xanthomonadaceae bacterium]|jgi:hypothetical protein|nr:hypothetical protein [Xanthomonadaceae bacterium]